LNVSGPQELESGLVDDLGVHNLSIADLQSMFGVDRVVTLLREIELTGSFVYIGIVKILVARSERVRGSQLVIEARTDVVAPAWIGHGIAKLNDLKRIGIHERRVHYLEVDDIAPLDVEEERGFLAERSANVSAVLLGMIAGLRDAAGRFAKGLRAFNAAVVPER